MKLDPKALEAAAETYASQRIREMATPSDVEGAGEDLRDPIQAYLGAADLVELSELECWKTRHAAAYKAWERAIRERDEARRGAEELGRRKDATYLERNQVVALLARLFPSGIRRTDIVEWDEEWHGCVYIGLPTGQVSWHYHDSHAYLFAHLPPYDGEYDGHTTEEKYERVWQCREGDEAEELGGQLAALRIALSHAL